MIKSKNGLQLSPDSTKEDEQADICSSINASDKIDLFEGLNLEEMCVPPPKKDQAKESSGGKDETGQTDELFDLNPLDGIDLKNLAVTPQSGSTQYMDDQSSPQNEDRVKQILVDEPMERFEKEREIEDQSKDHSLTPEPGLPLTVRKKEDSIDPIIEKAYGYAELTQIREVLFAGFTKTKGNVLLVASPHDNTGTSLLVAALGYNVACSCQKKVLLLDCNLRRAGLHDFFKIPLAYGFTELVQNDLTWQSVVKNTGFEHLQVITAGSPCNNFSDYLCDCHVPNLLDQVGNQFDLIIVDTSPVLISNRNNVSIVSLTSAVDYFLLVVKKAGSTRNHLKETQRIIEAGNGRIDAIVLNEYDPVKKKTPFF
jgi:Mrp family chromosome partitioning ATPase